MELLRNDDYRRIEDAILYLEQHYRDQPTLAEVASRVHLSKYHFQRLFTRWAGISPKRYLQALTLNGAKSVLDDSGSVLEASLEAGLSGPGRLHDLFVTHEAMTPGEFKTGGAGLSIRYGIHGSHFGDCLTAVTARGICWMSFVSPGKMRPALEALKSYWAFSELVRDDDHIREVIQRVFSPALTHGAARPVRVLMCGTTFQLKVWEALIAVPPGEVISYSGLARRIGQPRAARAVGNAVGANPVAYLIPCHRVIRKAGDIGNYRWGPERKRTMLAWETAQKLRQAG